MVELPDNKDIERLDSQVVETEHDIVRARQLIRHFAKQLGLGIVDQTRITTASSELFRNMYQYAGGGEVFLDKGEHSGRPALIITCIDHGPGISDLDQVLADGYTSGDGMGLGLPGSKRLVDFFHIESKISEGTLVRLVKWL